MDGLSEAGVTLHARGVGNFQAETAADAAREMFKADEKPDALFVANDHMAIAVMDVLRDELQLKIPEDVSIVSYDDVPAASWKGYNLTTIRQPADLMVNSAVDILLEQIADKNAGHLWNRTGMKAPKIEIEAPLILRGSARIPEGWDNEGFDPKWKDFPDYIIGITREIWEERGIATLHHYYAHDIPVRSPGSVVVGNQGVIAATMATLSEFPDRRLLGEDVIWSGSPEEGMLSSHRILSTATHLGDGVYGNASGQTLQYRIIC